MTDRRSREAADSGLYAGTCQDTEQSWKPVYGIRGELEALIDGGYPIQENRYNGLGCRIGMKKPGLAETEYLHDHTDPYRRVIMESGEAARHYLWHGDELLGMAGEENYVLTDALHTPIRVTDKTGRSKSCYTYDEFGIPMKQQEEIPLPFGYTGYLKEAVPGLYNANARTYDSRRGRFLTKDQYRYMDYEDPLSLDLYLYAKGNPLRYTDPGGHECIEEDSYLKRTVRHVILGSYTDDVTALGIGIDMLAGFFGVDFMLDARDLSADFTVNFNPTVK